MYCSIEYICAFPLSVMSENLNPSHALWLAASIPLPANSSVAPGQIFLRQPIESGPWPVIPPPANSIHQLPVNTEQAWQGFL